MKKISILFFICSVSCLSANALNEPQIDKSHIFTSENFVKIEGVVISTQTLTYANRPTAYLQILMRTDKGTIPVEMGPKWFIKDEGFSFFPEDHLIVEGVLKQSDHEKIIIATKIQTDEGTLHLRSSEGNPLWRQ